MAKIASNQAFLKAKKTQIDKEFTRQEDGEENSTEEQGDAFQVQHHHLLNCLENTTVSITLICLILMVRD